MGNEITEYIENHFSSKWENVRNFINNNPTFTKKEFKIGLKYIKNHYHTEDNYLNYAKQAGFINHIKRGVYIRICKIPDDINAIYIQKLAYDTNTDKLIKKLSRKEKLEKLQNL